MPERTTSAPAVTVSDVSKTFRIPSEQMNTLKERALHPFRSVTNNEFAALDDVSFTVEKGGFFGIVGRNGSGKSTLLKCLAGIYATDNGSIHIDGRVSTFIELGVGFNPDLAARDNVAINAAMLGLSRREARRRFDAVIDFAELRDFTALKLKNYSSGMMVRLAFAVMIEIDADVLLIDEVLAVGDASFQQKCFDEFEKIRASGRTVLLVTHDMGAVQRFCDQAILLEQGKVAAAGDSQTVGDRYLDINFSEAARERAATGEEPSEDEAQASLGDGRAVIERAWFELPGGAEATTLPAGKRITFTMQVRFTEAVEDPVFSVILNNARSIPLLSLFSAWESGPSGSFRAGESVLWKASFDNILGPDRYTVAPSVTLEGGAVLALRERFSSVVVTRVTPTGAIIDIPSDQVFQRDPPLNSEQGLVR
jgi:ABC-type polysaccharide/polyol phosphate transport system ATPase subunit